MMRSKALILLLLIPAIISIVSCGKISVVDEDEVDASTLNANGEIVIFRLRRSGYVRYDPINGHAPPRFFPKKMLYEVYGFNPKRGALKSLARVDVLKKNGENPNQNFHLVGYKPWVVLDNDHGSCGHEFVQMGYIVRRCQWRNGAGENLEMLRPIELGGKIVVPIEYSRTGERNGFSSSRQISVSGSQDELVISGSSVELYEKRKWGYVFKIFNVNNGDSKDYELIVDVGENVAGFGLSKDSALQVLTTNLTGDDSKWLIYEFDKSSKQHLLTSLPRLEQAKTAPETVEFLPSRKEIYRIAIAGRPPNGTVSVQKITY